MSDNKKDFDSQNDIDIERLCRLCRLSVPEDEAARYANELKKMADYTYPRVKRGDSALPFSYCTAKCELREDIAQESDKSECERILFLAASVADGYVSVPRIIKEENDE